MKFCQFFLVLLVPVTRLLALVPRFCLASDFKDMPVLLYLSVSACKCRMIVTLAYSLNVVEVLGGREFNMADPSTTMASVSSSLSGITLYIEIYQ